MTTEFPVLSLGLCSSFHWLSGSCKQLQIDEDGVVMASRDIHYFTWRNVVLMASFFHFRVHLGSLVFASVLLYVVSIGLQLWDTSTLCGTPKHIWYLLHMLATCYFFLILRNWLCPAAVLNFN